MATATNLATTLRIQEQEEGLGMLGARQIRTNEFGVTVGLVGDTEVIVSDFAVPVHKVDIESTEGNFYGLDQARDVENFAPIETWTRFRSYVVLHRAHWTARDGNFVQVTISDVRFER